MEFCNTVNDFCSDSNRVLKDLGALCKKYESICKEWELPISSNDKLDEGVKKELPISSNDKLYEDVKKELPISSNDISPHKLYEDVREEITLNKSKLDRKEMMCIVYGRVNSGKSTLINAMLSRNLLPAEEGPTTNSYVKMRRSNDKTDYIIFPDNIDRMDLSTINRVNEAETTLQYGSNVQVFLAGNNWGALQDDVVIIDTPGIGTLDMIDDTIYDMRKKADLLILVVNSTTGISENDENLLTKFKTGISKFRLLVVFSHWDKIKDTRRETLRNKYIEIANKYLNNNSRGEVYGNDDRIFFLSSLETINIRNNADQATINPHLERNQSFNNFLRLFKKYCDIPVSQRQLAVMEIDLKIINKAFEIMTAHKELVQKRFKKKVKINLKECVEMNEIINKILNNLFDSSYETFFISGLKSLKINNNGQANAEEIMTVFINEQVVVIVETIKVAINELFSKSENKDFILKIFDKLYFRNYINIDILIGLMKSFDLYPAFNDILATIQRHRKFAIAGFSLGGGAIVAPIGIGLGILVPIVNAVAIPVAVGAITSLGMTGAGVSATLSLMASKFERMLFKPRYEEYEKHLSTWWCSMKVLLIDSYEKFLKNLDEIILATTFEDDFNNLKSHVDEFNDKWNHIFAHITN